MSSEYHCTSLLYYDLFSSLSLYAMYKMVGCVQNELNSMRDGLHDVIPLELLSGLAAEVGQLLHPSSPELVFNLPSLHTLISLQNTIHGY